MLKWIVKLINVYFFNLRENDRLILVVEKVIEWCYRKFVLYLLIYGLYVIDLFIVNLYIF